VSANPDRVDSSSLIENVTDRPQGTRGFRASGKIASDEYRRMIDPIYAALERGEKLNMKAQWAMAAMLKMRKLDSAELERAAEAA
jgi:hypothetical protein